MVLFKAAQYGLTQVNNLRDSASRFRAVDRTRPVPHMGPKLVVRDFQQILLQRADDLRLRPAVQPLADRAQRVRRGNDHQLVKRIRCRGGVELVGDGISELLLCQSVQVMAWSQRVMRRRPGMIRGAGTVRPKIGGSLVGAERVPSLYRHAARCLPRGGQNARARHQRSRATVFEEWACRTSFFSLSVDP